jgi:hypothetical protein
MSSGFTYINKVLTIDKDPQAQLVYTFEWIDWLNGDSLAIVEYSIQARLNDPNPLTIIASGISETKTYVELANGQLNKSYTVTAKITTTSGLTDSRSFKVNVDKRSA